MSARTVAVTGADGFIGRNLVVRLGEAGLAVRPLTRASTPEDWDDAVGAADAAVHLAGANRPADPAEFDRVNAGTADRLATAVARAGRPMPVLYASTSRATDPTDYGRSKKAGEDRLVAMGAETGSPVFVFRLPNVFGKWARPNYNSAVATFCHNVARERPIRVDDPATPLTLVYIDDVVDRMLACLAGEVPAGFVEVTPTYATTVGHVADTIRGFATARADNRVDQVGTGLTRALYATYIAALPPAEFSYPLTSHRDDRGAFSEVVRTPTAGQFSTFTAHPGVTRGGHYHHTKTEKFLIVRGEALFRFRHILTGERHEIRTAGDRPEVVETVPGWTHDVTNVGDGELIALLWANELFDRDRPDTVMAAL